MLTCPITTATPTDHSGSQHHSPGGPSPPPLPAFLGKTDLLGLLSPHPGFANPCLTLSYSLGCASICLPCRKASAVVFFVMSIYESLSHCKCWGPRSTFSSPGCWRWWDTGVLAYSLHVIPPYLISSCWGATWAAASVRGSHDPSAVKFTWHLLHPHSCPRQMVPNDKSKYCFNVF